MSTAPIRVGLVGFGFASVTFHVPLLLASPEYAITAVASTSPERVRAVLPDVAVVPDVRTIVARADVDLVVIATPPAVHAEAAVVALRAGKHVVVEKPFVPTLAEADELVMLAEEQHLVCSVFQNRRWDGDFLTARALIESGTLGDVLTIESHFDRYRPHVRDRWREKPGAGAGMLYDLGAHLIDQVLVLFGPPDTLWADLGTQRSGSDADAASDYAHLVLRWGPRRAILHVGMMVAAPGPRFAIHGTQGSYVTHGLDPQEDAMRAGGVPGQSFAGMPWGSEPPEAFGTLAVATPDADPHAVRRCPYPTRSGDYPAYYADLARAIRGDGTAPVTAEEGRAVIRAIALAQRSAHTGTVVAWDALA